MNKQTASKVLIQPIVQPMARLKTRLSSASRGQISDDMSDNDGRKHRKIRHGDKAKSWSNKIRGQRWCGTRNRCHHRPETASKNRVSDLAN